MNIDVLIIYIYIYIYWILIKYMYIKYLVYLVGLNIQNRYIRKLDST